MRIGRRSQAVYPDPRREAHHQEGAPVSAAYSRPIRPGVACSKRTAVSGRARSVTCEPICEIVRPIHSGTHARAPRRSASFTNSEWRPKAA